MDQSRLDDLTRFVAQRIGRRSLATGTLGALLAGVLPGLEPPATAAAPRQRWCRRPRQRCGKHCVNIRNHRKHCGTCNRRCERGQLCRRGECWPPRSSKGGGPTPPPPPPPRCGKGGPCLVFVTSSKHRGNLNGLDGADAICNQRAVEAQLPGFYKAWVSDEFGDPVSRFTRNDGPYVLTDGTRIADTWDDLVDGELLAPINIMENGHQAMGDSTVWAGTNNSGTHYNYDCEEWTSSSEESYGQYGVFSTNDGMWSGDPLSLRNCSNVARLYCFQQS